MFKFNMISSFCVYFIFILIIINYFFKMFIKMLFNYSLDVYLKFFEMFQGPGGSVINMAF